MSPVWFVLLLTAGLISADVQSDVKDLINQFPWDIQTSNPEVLQSVGPKFRSAAQSSQLKQINDVVQELSKVPAVKNLLQYFENRGIEADKILFNLLNSLNRYQAFAGASTIGDVLNIIAKTLFLPEVSAVIEKKKDTDSDFAKLAEAIKEPEFKVLFYRALNARAVCANCNGNEIPVRGFWIGVSFTYHFGK